MKIPKRTRAGKNPAPRGDYWVTVTIDPDAASALRRVVFERGATRILSGRGRGVVHPKKWGPFTLPSLSPSWEIMHFFTPGNRLFSFLNAVVRAGRLDHFGAGSVYATPLSDLRPSRNSPLFEAVLPTPAEEPAFDFQSDLFAVHAISQIDRAEAIARAAMEAGSPSPILSFGTGHGIRDRLNFFLQLAIDPRKELIEVVVGAAEADRIFEEMIVAGRLDQPAQGFIFDRRVEFGLINTASHPHASPYPATMEQIIRAIDGLQGGTRWRTTGSLQFRPAPHRRTLRDLVSLNAVVKRGHGDEFSLLAMEAGAGGSSSQFLGRYASEEGAERCEETEMLTMSFDKRKLGAIVKAIGAWERTRGVAVDLFSYETPRAVTYVPSGGSNAALEG